MAGAAGAALVQNGFFQDPIDLNGWSTVGDVRIGNPTTGDPGTPVSPWEQQGMDDRFALLGFDFSNGTSTMAQEFWSPATDTFTVRFNWAFDYIDLNLFKEDRFLSVFTSAGNFDITMLDLASGLIGTAATFDRFEQTFDVFGFGGGWITIAFGLDESPGIFSPISWAAIDNVAVIPAAPVPIPATLLLFGSGLLGLVGLRKRIRRE